MALCQIINFTCICQIIITLQVYYNNTNNNCKTSIAPISLKRSSSYVQQTISFGYRVVIHRDRQKLSLEHGTTENLWWKRNFKQIFFQLLIEGVYSFKSFIHNRELIPNCRCSHRESTFANIQLSLRNKMLFGNR